MAPPQVADDAEIVRAAAGHAEVPVPAGGHQGLREGVRRLVDPAADQRGRAPRVQGATLDRRVVPLAGLLQRHVQPPLTFLLASQPRLRGAVEQGEGRRLLELGLLAPAQVLGDRGVASRCGELLGLVDDF